MVVINTTMSNILRKASLTGCNYIDRSYEFNTVIVDGKDYLKVKPCCHAHWGKIPSGVKFPLQEYDSNEQVTNNPVIQWFRDESKTGVLPDACGGCKTVESKGGISPRMDSIQDYDPDYDLYILDVHTGNECNLACAMCNSYSSSLINKQRERYTGSWVPSNWEATAGNDQNSTATFAQLDQILSKHKVQIVKFKGGEPMVKRNWQNIERGLKDGVYADTWLRITTNGTNLNSSILETLSLAKRTTVIVSVDGIGAVGEFIRWPQTADKIRATLDTIGLNKHKNIEFNTSTIITMLNIGDIANIHQACSSVAKRVSFDFDLKPEGHPLDYRNIPISIRTKLRNSIDPTILHKDHVPLRNLIDIEHPGWTRYSEVRRTLDWFEDHRGKDLINVLHPYIYKWYESLHAS